jgi:hypothetical protein
MRRRPSSTQCTICKHREHAAIDLALARGVSVGALARRFKVGSDSLYRHKRAHLTAPLRAKLIAGHDLAVVDLERLRTDESASLLSNLVALRHRLFAGLDAAEEAGDANMVARVSNQLHRNFELVAKLLGDLNVGTTINNNVLILPAYIELRVQVTRALSAYPEARQAVAAVLHQLESKAADAIRADAEVVPA